MANEIKVTATSGSTLYVVLMNATAQVYNQATNAFETLVTAGANWTTSKNCIVMSRAGGSTTSQIYVVNMPTTGTPAGRYSYIAYQQSGGSPAENDIIIAQGAFDWTSDNLLALGIIMPDNIANNSSGGLPTIGTGTGQFTTDGSGHINSNISLIAGQTASASTPVAFPSSVGTSTYAGGAVASVTGNVNGNVNGSVASVTGNVSGNVLGTVGGVAGNVIGQVTGTVGGVIGTMAGNLTGTVGGVNGNVTGSVGSVVSPVPLPVGTSAGDINLTSTGNININPSQPLDLTQGQVNTVGAALNAAIAQGFGKWIMSGTTLSLYDATGEIVLRTFTVLPTPVAGSRS